jgi:4-hydroxybenzoyl-CoA thioesterase
MARAYTAAVTVDDPDGASQSGVHVMPVRVHWGMCDPAGIVYFPRFFELFHQAMETWFSDRLAAEYDVLIVERKIGFPAVHTEADFRRPTCFGETIAVELRVRETGHTSIAFDYLVRAHEEPSDVRATGHTVCVVMDLDPSRPTFRRAIPMPQDLRDKIEAFRRG